MAHVEMITAMIYQLTDGVPPEVVAESELGTFYAIRDSAVFPVDSTGNPWTSAYIQAHGDPVTDLHEDMAAEQKARATYEHLLKLTDDPDVLEPLRFLRQREVVHFQRFGEVLDDVQFYRNSKKYY